MTYLKTGEKPTWLIAETSSGDSFVIGTQSRYDVNPIELSKYYTAEGKQLYAHGTSKISIYRNINDR